MNARGGFLRNNAFLVAAVALPVLVVVFFLVATASPRWTVPPPAYDLVLRVGKPYEQPRPQVSVEFKVVEGRLEAVVRPMQKDQYGPAWGLFRFDHQTLNLQEIPLKIPDSLPADSDPHTFVVDAFAGRRLLEQARAPDGYELRTDGNRASAGLVGELFGMRGYDQNVTLVNRGRVVKLPLPAGYQYVSPVTAIGWLTDAR